MTKITANLSIIANKANGYLFVAGEYEEKSQLQEFERHKEQFVHIGELAAPIPSIKTILNNLYNEIKHGDEEHQKWLKDKIDVFIAQKCLE